VNSDDFARPERLAIMEIEQGYRENFVNLELWTPYVQAVCRRHGLGPVLPVQAGVAGTYPTFIAGSHWVVKFFGRIFNGQESFWTEKALGSRLNLLEDFPAPALVASGELFPDGADWPWPYLVQEYLPGLSFGEIGSILGRRVRRQLAGELGCLARRIHSLPAPDWGSYLDFLAQQRSTCFLRLKDWGWMPPGLLAELDDFLLPPAAFIDPEEDPHWVHADLTRDHLIGRWDHGTWTTLGLIDFGDARTGSLYFELPALHLGFFEGDARLLTVFLDAYQYERPMDEIFRQKALGACLLFPFDVIGPLWERKFSPNPPASLPALAARLFSTGPATDG